MTYVPVAGPWIIVPYSGTYVLENVHTKEYYQEPAIARYLFLEDAQVARDKLNAETQEQPMRQITLTTTHHGDPNVCSDPLLAAITHEGPGIVAVEIDLDVKYCDQTYAIETGAPPKIVVFKGSLDNPTFIQFPDEFIGWTVFVADISRYTLRACLTKEE